MTNSSQLLVHGHSCCEVRTEKISLICDPWLLGSSYWRSWWNFPEPTDFNHLLDIWSKKDLLFVYITHLHWDHFHGPTLRNLIKHLKNTIFLIPETPEPRLRKDLASVVGKDKDIIELTHAKWLKLSSELSLLSFQTGIGFADSILSISISGKNILNMNDAKILPLSEAHLLSLIPKPNYVLRSHSSANDRCCFRNQEGKKLDKFDKNRLQYSIEFFNSCYATGAEFAIPFASNMSCLHRETFQYNSILNFSDYVYKDFQKISSEYPGMKCQLLFPSEKILLSNNELVKNTSLRQRLNLKSRDEMLREYQLLKKDTLEKQYKIEKKELFSPKLVEKYFNNVIKQTPIFIKLYLRNHINFEVSTDKELKLFCIDFLSGKVRNLSSIKKSNNTIIVRVKAHVINDVCKKSNYNSLGVSKRLEVLMRYDNNRYGIFNTLCNVTETGSFIPLKNILRKKYFSIWLRRYLEILDVAFYLINSFIHSKKPLYILESPKKRK